MYCCSVSDRLYSPFLEIAITDWNLAALCVLNQSEWVYPTLLELVSHLLFFTSVQVCSPVSPQCRACCHWDQQPASMYGPHGFVIRWQEDSSAIIASHIRYGWSSSAITVRHAVLEYEGSCMQVRPVSLPISMLADEDNSTLLGRAEDNSTPSCSSHSGMLVSQVNKVGETFPVFWSLCLRPSAVRCTLVALEGTSKPLFITPVPKEI